MSDRPPTPPSPCDGCSYHWVFRQNQLLTYAPSHFPATWGLSHSPIGLSLRELLEAMVPGWAQHLSLSDSCFLPWHQKTSLAHGFKLTLIANGDDLYASLEPALSPVSAENKDPAYAQLVASNKALKARLDHYQDTFPGVLFYQRPDGSFSYFSSKAQNILGENVLKSLYDGPRFLDLIHEDDREKFQREIANNKVPAQSIDILYRLCLPGTQEMIYIQDIRTPQYAPNGTFLGYEGLWIDRTRQAIAETRLTRSAWKETLATLTASLVHDFSNVMAGIFSLSEIYCSKLSPEDPMHEGLLQINKSAQEARKLVRRLIDLNREESRKKTYHNIETLITSQLDLIKAILPKYTKISTNLSGTELPVYLDDVSFRQVLLNFAINSRDALQKEGKISLSVHRVTAHETIMHGAFGAPVIAPKDGIELHFSDNGEGIKPEDFSKIFTPFFTTKEISKGSGFGLYNIRLFAEENEGILRFASTPGEGTTFFLFLPLAKFEAENIGDNTLAQDTGHRPSFVIYAAQDPNNFEVTHLFQEKEWEVVTFSDAEKVKACIQDFRIFSPTLFLIDLGQDPSIPTLIDHCKSCYPDLKVILQVHGRNPHQMPSHISQSVDALIGDNVPPHDFIQQLETLL